MMAAMKNLPIVLRPLLALSIAVLPGLALAGSNLIDNGSFEANAQAAGSWSIAANLTDWIGGANGIELRNDVAGTAFDGSNFVELDTTANSSMSQSFATVVGRTYELSFAYAARPDNKGAASNGISWSAGDHSNIVFGTNTDTAWTVVNTSFVATSTKTTLSFAAVGISDSYGTSLDDVSVTMAPELRATVHELPEPGGYALVFAGLFAMGAASRRGKKA
jgi:hypothetical protein